MVRENVFRIRNNIDSPLVDPLSLTFRESEITPIEFVKFLPCDRSCVYEHAGIIASNSP